MLRPPVSKFRALDFLKIDQVLSITEPVRRDLRAAVVAKLPALAERARALDAMEGRVKEKA